MEHYNPSPSSPDNPEETGQHMKQEGELRTNGAVASTTKENGNVKERFNRGIYKVREGFDSSRQATSTRLRDASYGIRDLEARLDQGIEQAREKASAGLEATSRRIDDLAGYLEQHDSQQMWEDMKVVVRRNPGKSILTGLLVGVVLGRLFR